MRLRDGCSIKVRRDEDIGSAIRRFKRVCERERIVAEIRERQFYVKPSIKKRLKRAEAVRARKMAERDEERGISPS